MVVCPIVASASPEADQKKKDWPQLLRYKEQNKQVAQLPAQQRRVVVFGNSIAAHWALADSAFFVRNGYVGRGIGGQTSYHFLVRFAQDVIALRPETVVIIAGTNDIAENFCPYDEEQTFINIVALSQMAQANGITPVLSSVLPASFIPWNRSVTGCAEKIAELNRRLKSYAERNGIPYADFYSAMVEGDDRRLHDAYTADGVHPNLEGYRVMERILQEVLR